MRRELVVLEAMAVQVQADLGEILRDHPAPEPEVMSRLQGIDRLTQSIACIADFLDGLGTDMPDAWAVDAGRAAQNLLLADLAVRLSQGGLRASRSEIEAAGDATFF